jgi:hypothetical protein
MIPNNSFINSIIISRGYIIISKGMSRQCGVAELRKVLLKWMVGWLQWFGSGGLVWVVWV